MMAEMKRLTLQTTLQTLVFVSLGFASFRQFSDNLDSDCCWFFFVFGCATSTAALGVLLDDVWPSIAVGLWIGLWIAVLSVVIRT
jgi:hypothetical protein